jgi:hypothetical protein
VTCSRVWGQRQTWILMTKLHLRCLTWRPRPKTTETSKDSNLLATQAVTTLCSNINIDSLESSSPSPGGCVWVWRAVLTMMACLASTHREFNIKYICRSHWQTCQKKMHMYCSQKLRH